MARVAKFTFWILIIVALGLAQWRYNLTQQAMNYLHPTPPSAAEASGEKPAVQGGDAKRAAPPVAVKLAQASKADFPLIERSYGTMASPQVVNVNARLASRSEERRVGKEC